MLTQQGMQTHSEGEPGTNKRPNQKKKKGNKTKPQQALGGTSATEMQRKTASPLFDCSQGQSFWHGVGLWRHSHKGLTTTLSCWKTQHCADSVKGCDRGWLQCLARLKRWHGCGLGTQQTWANSPGTPLPIGQWVGS